MRLLSGVAIVLLAAAVACSDSNGPPADPITGMWNGKFDNGIQINAPLVLIGDSIAGTYGAGSDSGVVTGEYTDSTFELQLTATVGTQRTLSDAELVSSVRITALWDDGAGQDGEVCFAKQGSTACP